jgi:hypothetical protein
MTDYRYIYIRKTKQKERWQAYGVLVLLVLAICLAGHFEQEPAPQTDIALVFQTFEQRPPAPSDGLVQNWEARR